MKVEDFEQLHNYLEYIADDRTNGQSPTKITQYINLYIQYIIYSDKQSEQIYDTFTQLNGLQLLKKLVPVYHIQILNGLSLLFINLTKQSSIAYLLCHPIVSYLIENKFNNKKQQYLEYYISMIKSLTLRLDANKIALFYNMRYYNFPIAWEASKLYNHKETMVRASIMTIILRLMQIKNDSVRLYFSSFPFITFFINLVCNVKQKWFKIENELSNIKSVKILLEDQKDVIMFLQDILQIGDLHINLVIKNCILIYLIKPLIGAFTQNSKGTISITLSLYLLLDYMVLFSDHLEFIQFICYSLLGRYITKKILEEIQIPNYLPKFYNSVYTEENYFDKFKEIQGLTKNVLNEIDKKEKLKIVMQQQLRQQIQIINNSLGVDLIDKKKKQFWFYTYKDQIKQSVYQNPIRNTIFSFLKTKDNILLQLVTKILIFFIKNKNLKQQVLSFCGLLLPRHSQLYQQQFNLMTLQQLTDSYLNLIESELPCSSDTLHCIFYMLDQLLFKSLLKQLKQSQKMRILKIWQKMLLNIRKILKGNFKLSLIVEIEPILQQEFQLNKYVDENLLNQSNFVTDNQQQEIRQYLITFNYIAKLRYKYIKKSKFKKEKIDLKYLYETKFTNQSSRWYVGLSLVIQNRSLIQCYSKTHKKRVIIVNDNINFLVVKQNDKLNETIILANTKYKYLSIQETNQQNVLIVKLDNNNSIILSFQNEFIYTSTKSKIEESIQKNINEEVVFLLNYINDCLNDLK